MNFNDSSLVASRRTVARLRRSVRDIIRLFRRPENILTCWPRNSGIYLYDRVLLINREYNTVWSHPKRTFY